MTAFEKLNADWLAAFSDQDAERLAALYAEDCRYFDTQLPDGLEGREALRDRFSRLFELAPSMAYEPDRVWSIEGGFCSRWICTIRAGDVVQKLRGFSFVLLRDGRILHHEVYTHPVQTDFRAAGGPGA